MRSDSLPQSFSSGDLFLFDDDLSQEFLEPEQALTEDSISPNELTDLQQLFEDKSSEPSIILREASNANVLDKESERLTQRSLPQRMSASFIKQVSPRDSAEEQKTNELNHQDDHSDIVIDVKPSPSRLREPLLSDELRNLVSDTKESKEYIDSEDEDFDEDFEEIHQSNGSIPRKVLAALLTLSLYFNATMEMTDGFSTIEGNIHLFPFPTDPDFLAIIPNNGAVQTSLISLIGLYTLRFDYENLAHGLEEVINAISLCPFQLNLPSTWKELWEKKGLNPSKLNVIANICFVISAFSIFTEIVNSLSMSKDNTEETAQQQARLTLWLRWATSFSIVNQCSSILGNLAFLFCEAFKLPDAALQFFAGQRGMKATRFNCFGEEEVYLVPYPRSYELITLPARIAGSVGAGLFALISARKFFTEANGINWYSVVCLNKCITSAAYDGEWTLYVSSRLFNTMDEIRHGILPSFQELLAFLLVTFAGGISAYVQEKLTEDYYEDLGGSDFCKNYILAPLTLLYAIKMWVDYSGTWYDPANQLLTRIRNGFGSIFCRNAQPNHDDDSPRSAAEDEYKILNNEPSSDSTVRERDPENPTLVTTSTVPEKKATSRLKALGNWFSEKASSLRRTVCGKRPSEMTTDESDDLNTEKISTPFVTSIDTSTMDRPTSSISENSAEWNTTTQLLLVVDTKDTHSNASPKNTLKPRHFHKFTQSLSEEQHKNSQHLAPIFGMGFTYFESKSEKGDRKLFQTVDTLDRTDTVRIPNRRG